MTTILTFLSGKKTYIAAILAAAAAFNSIVPIVSPDLQNTILSLAGALGLVGIRHAISKATDEPKPS